MKYIKTLLLTLLLMLAVTFANAADLVENSITDYLGFSVHNLTLTMDSGGATAEAMSYAINGTIIAVDTNPGTTAPTDNYDMTITNTDGVDIMGGALANRDTANSERAYPLASAVVVEPPNTGILTINIASGSNTATDPTVVLKIYTTDEKKGTLSW